MSKVWLQSLEAAEYTEAVIVTEMEPHLDTYLAVMSCQRLTGRFPETTLEIRSRHLPADYFDVGGMFIVSERVKAVLDEFAVPAEYFLLRIMRRSSRPVGQRFYFCNLLDCVAGLDLARGKYTFWKKPGFADHVQKVRKLAIDEPKVASYPLFRLAKCSPNIVCASDQLADRIRELRLTGMRFVVPEEWRFGAG
jgi:hypothetical protein